ncbi:MAG TPA: alpha/beta fold hydrolase [Rickettsiales bacterium]|nr:alpha/beta fold hydrolase [Rickettsiales bacterium]
MNIQNTFANNDYVVLIHGLARTSKSMEKMGKFLSQNGYEVVNINYPSHKQTIEEFSNIVNSDIQKYCTDKTKKINFVTHSMGSIILRYYLKNNKLKNLGRVVMLAPPNHGTEIVDFLGYNKIFGWLFKALQGPAAMQLSTDPKTSLPIQLGKADFEVGIIIGNKHKGKILSYLIKGENDGRVSIESSKLEGMKEHIVISGGHRFLPDNKEAIQKTLKFLQTGSFN